MTPADLTRTVVRAVRCAVEDGELPADAAVPARVVVERSRPGGVGEYATPVAFQVAKAAGRAPGEVARVLAGRLGGEAGIARVEVTGAGFLNFVLEERSSVDVVRDVLRLVAGFPTADPLPAGELRAAVVGRAVGRIVRSQGSADAGPPPNVAPVARRDGDVVARFGGDAAVWAMLCVPAHETPSFGDALLVQDESSEFFRVRYAHARAVALVRNARLLGFGPQLVPAPHGDGAPLLRVLADHSLVLEAAAHHRAPERLARHLVELADALLDFQYRVLPKGDEKPSAAHRARLALAEAAGTVLAGGLALLGIHAPDCL
ncbi:ArgS-related anticodon-binding protein NrtL [Streptomyces sp. NPDC127106]|uniref:ArgS-related anticodon-binding protein NrtL n=1 Tax=Streptomyces sp. NPDC127106 TaxID=3345360 RepID=UPI003625393D